MRQPCLRALAGIIALVSLTGSAIGQPPAAQARTYESGGRYQEFLPGNVE